MQTKTDTVQGRQEEEVGEAGGGWGGYGLTTGTSLTGTCYQQATKIMERQLWNRRVVVVTGQSLAASQNCSQSQGRVRLGASGDLRPPCAACALRIFTLWRCGGGVGGGGFDTEQGTV